MLASVIAICAFSFFAEIAGDAEVRVNPGTALKWDVKKSSKGATKQSQPARVAKDAQPQVDQPSQPGVQVNPGTAMKWPLPGKGSRSVKKSERDRADSDLRAGSSTSSYPECIQEYSTRSSSLHVYKGFGAWMNKESPLKPIDEDGFDASTRRIIFNSIYEKNMWNWKGGMASGIGSSFEMAGPVWCALERIVAEREVTSICDAGVGDFRWMHLFLRERSTVRRFVGLDISDVVVQALSQVFTSEVAKGQYEFRTADLVCGDKRLNLDADLVILRDVLQHQRLLDAAEILRCLDESGAKFLLVSSYHAGHSDVNRDLTAKGAALSSAHIALHSSPFHFPEPLAKYSEYNHEEPKSLLLYKLPIGITNFVDSSFLKKMKNSQSSFDPDDDSEL